MKMDKAERKILDMIEQGALSAEEGLRLMNAMGSDERQGATASAETFTDAEVEFPAPEDVIEPVPSNISEEELKRIQGLKRWWILPFGIGLLILTLGAIWMFTGYSNNGFGWGFWLAWITFLLGIFIVAVSFQTRRSVWLHVRVKQKPGEKPERISISLPLPVSLTKWFLATFGSRINGLKDQPLGDISDILEEVSPEEPFYVHVNEDDGEEVEVFIG